MTLRFSGLSALCVAAILAGGTLTPLVATAEPAAASEADYATFSAAIDNLQIFEMMAEGLKKGAQLNEKAVDLTPAQKEVVAAAMYREFSTRRASVLGSLKRKAFKSFNHDEIAQVSNIAARPGAARFTMTFASGNPEALKAVENEPFAQGLSEGDADLYFRLFQVLMSDQDIVAEMEAALAVALVEARASKP